MVRKSAEQITQETDLELVKEELKNAPEPADDEGLSPEFLRNCKISKNRFANLVPREPRSQKVTIRFETSVLSFLKQDASRLGKPYQTHINDILRTYAATAQDHQQESTPQT